MKTRQLLLISATPVIASLLGYLINQLPAIPNFPNKDRWILAGVGLVTLLAIAIAFWQGQQEANQALNPTDETLRRIRQQLITTCKFSVDRERERMRSQ